LPARTVTIFGSATALPGDALYQSAEQLGRRCAQSGWRVCNGGYGGTMEASARGAADAGGHTIGVTCSAFGRDRPNRWIAEKIETDNLFDRLRKLIELGDAYVMLPGGTGTLTELALAWELRNKALIPSSRAMILLGTFWTPVIAHQPGANVLPTTVDTVAAAIEHLTKTLTADR
jgi:hypothetical protein